MKRYFETASIPKPNDLGAGSWQLSGLTPITTLFGKNGCGKSRLLRAWRNQDAKSIHYVVPERSGDIEFEPGYLRQQIDPTQRQQASQYNFVDQYRRIVIARVQAYFLTRGSVRADRLPGDPADLEKLLGILLPDFSFVLAGSTHPPYEMIRNSTGNKVNNIHELSSGEAQVFTVALDLLTIAAIWKIEKNPQRLVLIDEPDAHIHPDLQVRFADFVVRTATEFELQIVVASHSTTLLSALGQFGGEKASVVYLDRTKSEFKAVPFLKEAKELAACLGGHALMGPLFGVPLLLVEGDDDYRIWSQVPRHHVTSFSVIPCNGDEIKRYQKSLETILGAIRDNSAPAGFALLDGDKQLPKAQDNAPQNQIKFISLACHEAENLYLTNNVLSLLDLTWDQACERIKQEATKYGNKAERLSKAAEWDRQKVDIHELINEISAILDQKNVNWTMRVARAIGEKRPEGELLLFLGDAVVDSLWGPLAPEPALQAA